MRIHDENATTFMLIRWEDSKTTTKERSFVRICSCLVVCSQEGSSVIVILEQEA
jgi:hypothetical protein